MAFLAPVIAPLVGLGSLGLVGEAIVGIGLSFGVSYLARKLQPSPSNSAATGMQLSLSYNANGPRQIAFGLCASAGSLVYHNTYGPNGNDYVQLVFKLADSPCTSLEKVLIDGTECTLGAEVTSGDQTGYTVEECPGVMWIKFHDGAWDQSADADLVSKATGSDGWSTNNRGRGVCYVRVTLKYDPEKFKNGIPPFLFVFKGARLYDWRKDSTAGGSGSHRWGTESTYEWTDNPAVCLYNYKHGIYVDGKKVGGMNVFDFSLPLEWWTAAANVCDETVGLKAGGTEKRYRLNGIVNVDTEHATVVRDMVSAMAGTLADTSGVFKVYAGAARAPVLTITDDDLISNVPVKFVPKLSRSSLVNSVFGSFNDPSKLYQSSSLPPRISPADIEADGGVELSENYSLSYVSSGTQGQRILEILRRRGRYQRSLAQTLCAKGAILESGDWITYNSNRYGFDGVTFEVTLGTLNRDATVPIELREVSDSIFAWAAEDDELDALDPADVGPGGTRLNTVQGISLATAIVPGDGDAQLPALSITWTPITDATVTGLLLEYREVGSPTAQSKTIFSVSSGSYQWTEGIQGGLVYEARLTPITIPERAVVASAWVQTPANTAPVIVDVAAVANTVPDGAITPAKLSAQAALELSMATGLASLQGSVNERAEELLRMINQAALASMGIGSVNQSAVRITNQNLQTLTESFAEYKIEVNAQINDPVTGIPAVAASVLDLQSRVEATEDGIEAAESRVFLGVTVDGGMGLVTGGIDLYANEQFSSLGFAADRTFFTMPDGSGAKNIVTFGELADGSTGVAIDAEQTIIKGSVKADHLQVVTLESVTNRAGTLISGKLRRPDNLVYFDLDQGELRITTPQMLDLRFKVNSGYIPAIMH